jgi:hypothetical protein
MRVLKPGRQQRGWSKEFECTGKGNGGGGCGAVLLVEQGDLYKTYSHALYETDTHVTFCCAACGVETDVDRAYTGSHRSLPDKSDWLKRGGGRS